MSIFAGKTLMITGGTGSFGNAVLNRFLRTDIGEIRIFSRDEKKQDDMRHEYQHQNRQVVVEFDRDQTGQIMSVEDTRHARKHRGNCKGNQFVFGDVDADGLRRDTVVPDRHDRPPCSGIDQIEDNNQGDEDQDKADDIVGIARRACNPHRAVNQFLRGQRVKLHIVVGFHAERHVQPVDILN